MRGLEETGRHGSERWWSRREMRRGDPHTQRRRDLYEARPTAGCLRARATKSPIVGVRRHGMAAPPCAPGAFGQRCEHNISLLFHEHEVYAGFEPLNSRVQGWGPSSAFYEAVVRRVKPRLVVEVGVWKGQSCLHLASAMKAQLGGGAVIAVDTWLGALEFWTQSWSDGRRDATRDLHFKHGWPTVYYHFLSNVVRANLSDFIIPFPAPSTLAHSFLVEKRITYDLVHVDAAHEYSTAAQDFALWWQLLRPGGCMLGDDFTGFWRGVVRAACEFAAKEDVDLYASLGDPATNRSVAHRHTKWWIFKPIGRPPGYRPTPRNRTWLRRCELREPDHRMPMFDS